MPPVRVAAVAAALVFFVAQPARAGFVIYTFTSDAATFGGSLAGSFRVDKADLLDGFLSTGDVTDYAFTLTDLSGTETLYAFSGVFPDIAVSPLTGVPLTNPSVSVATILGDQVGEAGAVAVSLTDAALAPMGATWVASVQPTGDVYSGTGHWQIGPDGVSPAPVPGGATLALIGAGCLTAVRHLRRVKSVVPAAPGTTPGR